MPRSSRDWTDEFTLATEGRQSYDPPPLDHPARTPITRETRDRIFRIIKDRSAIKGGASSDGSVGNLGEQNHG